MSLPSTPVWTMAHLGLKFPSAAICAGALFYVLADDPRPMVAITFDDARQSVVENALPVLKDNDMIATIYPTVSLLNTPTYVTKEELPMLVSEGWEIGAHGVDHVNFKELSEFDLQDNLITPIRLLAEYSGQEILSVATPYGEYGPREIAAIQRTYFNHVGAWGIHDGVNMPGADFTPMIVDRIDIDEDVSAEKVCDTIAGLPENSLYVILFHGVNDVPGKYNVTAEKFDTIIGCISDADVNVVRVSDGVQALEEKSK